ncbi:hypothetical protein DITRI_Ditri12bG0018400 [Diplodiscus trichospermus]
MTEISVLLCCVAFFCSSISASPLISPSGADYDEKFSVLALMGMKNLLVDPHGALDNWDETSRDPCSWNMVTCSPDGLVVGLGVPSQSLSGTLAPTIGNLTNIQLVLLQNNNISGYIPSEIGSLSKLQTLDLSNNRLSGQIPSTLSHLNSLRYLRLNNNNLSGEIPASLTNLTQLDFIDLSLNNLSGPVPSLPAKTFNIAGNPYICNNGAEKVGFGCADMNTGASPISSKARQKYPSGIYKSGAFHVMLLYWFFIALLYSPPSTYSWDVHP